MLRAPICRQSATRATASTSPGVSTSVTIGRPVAARAGLGWSDVPLICGREIPVPGALPMCIRVLLAWNTPKTQADVRHAFLHGARVLRPAWAIDLPGDAPLGVR